MVYTFFCCLFPFYHVRSIKLQQFEERDENKAVTQQQMAKQVSVFPIGGQLFLTNFPSSRSQCKHLETQWEMHPEGSTFLGYFLQRLYYSTTLLCTLLEGVQHSEGIPKESLIRFMCFSKSSEKL
jgi:hypothetical protein